MILSHPDTSSSHKCQNTHPIASPYKTNSIRKTARRLSDGTCCDSNATRPVQPSSSGCPALHILAIPQMTLTPPTPDTRRTSPRRWVSQHGHLHRGVEITVCRKRWGSMFKRVFLNYHPCPPLLLYTLHSVTPWNMLIGYCQWSWCVRDCNVRTNAEQRKTLRCEKFMGKTLLSERYENMMVEWVWLCTANLAAMCSAVAWHRVTAHGADRSCLWTTRVF